MTLVLNENEGYTQGEIDLLFNHAIVPKIMYGFSVNASSISDLTAVQSFLTRCNKIRHYTYVSYNIHELLEKKVDAVSFLN